MDFSDDKDKRFLSKMEQDIRLSNGHYEIPVPFGRKSDVLMPNNRGQALKRALWQKKKIQRDTKYHRDYINFMNEVIRKSYARKISEKAVNSAPGKVWYIQHHSVYHPRKPGKVRVVFDCSVKYLGTSLNEQLLQGPDLTNSLIRLLTRFRQEHVAFMADIEAMSHQVRVPDEHWN